MRRLVPLLALLLLIAPAQAQQQTFQYQNIVLAAPTTTVIRSSAGVLHSVCLNTQAANGTATIYDNTAGSGTKIGTITGGAVTIGPICQIYDVQFWTGLTIVTATAAMDLTVSFR
jgi:hypothetical protein